MEGDNLPSGKLGWLLIKALCFLSKIEPSSYYSNMKLKENFQNVRQQTPTSCVIYVHPANEPVRR